MTSAFTISSVSVRLIKPQNSLLAIGRLVLNESLVLDSLGLHEKRSGGYRLTYPQKNGRTLFHPITPKP